MKHFPRKTSRSVDFRGPTGRPAALARSHLKVWLALAAGLLATAMQASDSGPSPQSAPVVDRVGFPRAYAETFQILRVVNKEKEQKVVTVYGNTPAASVTNAVQLPYPYGSVIVMETAMASKGPDGAFLVDARGNLRAGRVTGLHVMRREKGFGEAYGPSRSGEWEYVEYKADGGYITPPAKSAACAACHVKAGPQRDFVYRGRIPADLSE